MEQPQISPIEIDARITALVQQRNRALDEVAVLQGQLTVAVTKIKELEEKMPKPPEEVKDA